MKTHTLMLILALVVSTLSSCTTVVVHRNSGGGNHMQGGVLYPSGPDSTGRPIGTVSHIHTDGVETTQASVKFRIGADTKNQALVDQIRKELEMWYAHAHQELQVQPTEGQVQEKLKALFAAQPTLCHLQFTTEQNKRGGFGMTKFETQNITRTKVDGTPITTNTLIFNKSDIPAAAKHLPAVRGPEEWQPKKPQKPQGYRDQHQQPQPELPE